MAKLYFRYGAMGSSKTANAIMVQYNYSERGQKCLIAKPGLDTRDGERVVSSRSGLTAACALFEELDSIDISQYDCLIVDEAQFLTKEQVEKLVYIVDFLNVPVIAYGLRADFQQNLFEGSKWLLAWADTIEEVKTVCWCGKKATCNARISGGKVVKSGEQILLGGNESYVALCRKHWREGKPKPDGAITTVEKVEYNKKEHLELLLLADPYEEMVDRYLGPGDMYVLKADGETVCECVMLPRKDGAIELKNLATRPDSQRRGYASALVTDMFRRYAKEYGVMYVGTAGDAPFYRSLGFAHAYTVPNFFTDNYPEPIIDDGFLCVDMEYYKIDLTPWKEK